MTSQSRATIVGILVLAGRRLTATQLLRLAAPLGLSASNVKSHLTRMVIEGALRREGPRRLATYRPSPNQMLVIEGIQARLTETPEPAWDGTWLLLTLGLPQNRIRRERWRASLWFDGFRPLSADVFVRPSYPLPWAEKRARYYSAEISGFCIRGEFITASADLARLYDLDGLDSEACRVAAWIRRRPACAKSPRAAFVERMNVGGRVARFIGHDPRLPQALWGKRRGMLEIIEAFQSFEKRIAPRAQRFVDEANL
jgi:DNA-binding transcriptional regulator PaaX